MFYFFESFFSEGFTFAAQISPGSAPRLGCIQQGYTHADQSTNQQAGSNG
jgi:hypothetical protein